MNQPDLRAGATRCQSDASSATMEILAAIKAGNLEINVPIWLEDIEIIEVQKAIHSANRAAAKKAKELAAAKLKDDAERNMLASLGVKEAAQ